MRKTDFDNKLINFDRKITSNFTKYLEVQKKKKKKKKKKKPNKKRLWPFLGRIYFTSNGGSQNTFVYQPTLEILELIKEKKRQFDWLLGKILNIFIVYDLDTWPRNSISNFKFKNCLIWSN